jgi:hypothetical protein
MMLGGVSIHTRREPPGKAQRARATAERAREKTAQAQALRAGAEARCRGTVRGTRPGLARGRGAARTSPFTWPAKRP